MPRPGWLLGCFVLAGCELLPSPEPPFGQQDAIDAAQQATARCGEVVDVRMESGPPGAWLVTIETEDPNRCGVSPRGGHCDPWRLTLRFDATDGRQIDSQIGCAVER